uniref:serine racemase-like n=1 Tax=Styela clava TaxID=7725 RepID=UPI001939F668|nr:serine racemase-like [Styela clava]
MSSSYCCTLEDVTSAMTRIRPYVDKTPMMTSSTLNKMSGHKIFLKTENFQKTGSFKIRGATNAVLKIKQDLPDVNCVVCDSSGNHGQALARAAQTSGLKCYVVMPENSPKCKIDAVKGYGANVVLCEASEEARKRGADDVIKQHGGVYVSSSQTFDVIRGQGTLGLEIIEQNPECDVIVAAVAGGGMISGIATAVKGVNSSVKVIAAEPELANDCYISKKTGVLTPNPTFPNTIADGVKVSVGENTWPMIRDLIDDVITVSEDEIKHATLLVWERCKLVIEPTAGVAVAAVLSENFNKTLSKLFPNSEPKNVTVVLCGGNVDFGVLPELLNCAQDLG